MPLISIIIPTYQSAQFLPQSIESILNQTFKDFEVIVVDDGSTDSTSEVLNNYIPQIRVISQKNQGPSIARNTGIRASSGVFLAFLDADDFWISDKLEKQIRLLEENYELGLIFTNALILYNQISKGTIFDLVTPKSGWVEKDLFQINFMPMSTILVRRSCLERVGLFDENLPPCEDYDLWLRISHLYPVAFISEPLAYYRISCSQISQNDLKMLSALIKMKTKAINNNPLLIDLPLSILDQCYYNLYPRLAKYQLIDGKVFECRQILENYKTMRGRTLRYWLLYAASHLPTVLSRQALIFWGWIHGKSIMKVYPN
jgi:glycosyltransferase involved in cell wall biosynthesis